ncbi:MAG: DNA-processing protein DprA [Desulfopila sp.]
MLTHPALDDWLCLSLIPGLGPVGARRLLEVFDSPGAVLAADSKDLVAVAGIRTGQLEGFARLDECRRVAARQLAGIEALGGTILVLGESGYPALLEEISDPPLVLYALGDTALVDTTCLAIVGARSATTYGRRAARQLAEHLVDHQVTVVSGMALGIDTEAHRGALARGGATVAVLGCGLDVVYPPQNRTLYEQMKSTGLLLSEYPLATRPDGFRFPARNRIIAGMSRGVVVVEAARRSGSLITAQLALDFGREIFAVPGQIDSVKSEGAHWLLRQGAKLVANVSDIIEELQTGVVDSRSTDPPSGSDRELEPDGAALLHQLEPYPLSRDEIHARTGLPMARISELLLLLELEGYIEMAPGDLVRRLLE